MVADCHPPHAAGQARGAARDRGGLAVHCGFLALIAVLAEFNRFWVFRVPLLVLLLSVPGVILLRALRIPGRTVACFPVLIPCASIVVSLGSGLVMDLAGPAIGVSAPLRTLPLLVCLTATCLILLALSVNVTPDIKVPWRSISRPGRLAWPFILPLTAAAGAVSVNSGHGDELAEAALLLCVAALLVSMVLAARIEEPLLAVALYSIGLAIMWSYSLRGNLAAGSDIATEYQTLHQTIVSGIWHVAHPGDAYGGMLSVTVLPAELSFLSGLPGLLVLKAVFPLIGALFPLEIFGLARRILSPRWAFAAAAFTIAEVSFGGGLPAHAREEIALVFFAALVTVMLASRLARSSQAALVALLGLAMVVSHYPTTYIAIALIGLALLLQRLMSRFAGVARASAPMVVAFAVALAGALAWYALLTGSASGLSARAHSAAGPGPVACQELLTLLGALGALIMVARRKVSAVTRHIGLLGMAAVVFLAAVRLSGTAAVFSPYRQAEAFVQPAVILVVAFCWVMQGIGGVRKGRQAGALLLSTAFLAASVVRTSGLPGGIVDGMRAAHARGGADYAGFLIAAGEPAAAGPRPALPRREGRP
jgi:hypothetical protein